MSLRGFVGAVRDRLLPRGSLQSQTVRSGVWLGSTNLLDRGLQLLMLLVLSRLLGPRAFGLIGIALLTVGATNKISTLGVNAALIQKEATDVDRYLDTAWVLKIGRYVLVAAVLVAVAPFVAAVFGEPRTTSLIRVVAIAPLLRGFKNPGVVYFRKHLAYHRHFLYRTSGSIVQFAVAVIWAALSPSVWAFVAAYVAADATRTIVSHVLCSYRPGRSASAEFAKELIGYGKWLSGSSLLLFLYSQGDDVVVGALLGATALGFYQMAYRFSNAPATEFSEIVAELAFPALSVVRDDPAALRRGYLRVLRVTAFVTMPAATGIALTAPSFVPAVLGAEWGPMVVPMQLLSVYGCLRAIHLTFEPLWKAVGRPDYVTKFAALRTLLIAVAVVPATLRYGLTGTAGVIVGVAVVPLLPIGIVVTAGAVGVRSRRLATELVYPFAATGLMAVAVRLVGQSLVVPAPFEFVALVLTGVCSYCIVAYGLETALDWGMERTLRGVVAAVDE